MHFLLSVCSKIYRIRGLQKGKGASTPLAKLRGGWMERLGVIHPLQGSKGEDEKNGQYISALTFIFFFHNCKSVWINHYVFCLRDQNVRVWFALPSPPYLSLGKALCMLLYRIHICITYKLKHVKHFL